jgi:hypothetical protein
MSMCAFAMRDVLPLWRGRTANGALNVAEGISHNDALDKASSTSHCQIENKQDSIIQLQDM